MNNAIIEQFTGRAAMLKAKGVAKASGRYVLDSLRFEPPEGMDAKLMRVGNQQVKTLVEQAIQRVPSLKEMFTSRG